MPTLQENVPMNEQRQQAYFNLIQQLLNCPHGEEGKILQANAELVDEELVQVMEQVATMMEQQGEGNPAWLRSVAAGLSQHIQQSQSPTSREDYLAFLQEVLQVEWESDDNNQWYEPTGQAPAVIPPQGAGNVPKEIQNYRQPPTLPPQRYLRRRPHPHPRLARYRY